MSPELPPGALVLGGIFYKFDPATRGLDSIPRLAVPRPWPELLGRWPPPGLTVFSGSLITTPYIIHKAEQAGLLRSLTYPVLDLESATVASRLRAAGLPCLGLRAITDTAAGESRTFWPRLRGELGNRGRVHGTP